MSPHGNFDGLFPVPVGTHVNFLNSDGFQFVLLGAYGDREPMGTRGNP